MLISAGVVQAAGEKAAQLNGVLIAGEQSADKTYYKSFIDAIAEHRLGIE
ncbi:hypothetical protein [Paenibacillus sp. YAF4_2]